ncbi:MAG: DUF6516 family protein [bacterium]
MNKLLAEIVSVLDQYENCRNTQIMETAYFSLEQFAFKIRATLLSSLTLQIRIYYNKGHYDYSYQLFSDSPLCRWDNKEHFPRLSTFPHHYHTMEGKIVESPLKGQPVDDLRVVLEQLENLLKEQT